MNVNVNASAVSLRPQFTPNQFMDSGYFWAPYIPLTSTPVSIDKRYFTTRDADFIHLTTASGHQIEMSDREAEVTQHIEMSDEVPMVEPTEDDDIGSVWDKVK